MAERITQPKTSTSDAPRDPTVTDAVRVDAKENQAPPVPDDVLAVDPGKLSAFVVPMAMQREMLRQKPPRLGREYFQETLPPNKAPTASAAPTTLSRDSQPIPPPTKRRPPVGVVVVCLLGAVLLLALAILRSSHGVRETKPVVVARPSETLTGPVPVVAAPPDAMVVPPATPVTSADPIEPAVRGAPTTSALGVGGGASKAAHSKHPSHDHSPAPPKSDAPDFEQPFNPQ